MIWYFTIYLCQEQCCLPLRSNSNDKCVHVGAITELYCNINKQLAFYSISMLHLSNQGLNMSLPREVKYISSSFYAFSTIPNNIITMCLNKN